MRLLQNDMCIDEETELRQLESGAPVAGCAEPPLAEKCNDFQTATKGYGARGGGADRVKSKRVTT